MQVDGGWSHMLRLVLERLLVGPLGLSTVGVPVRVGGEERLLFATLTNLLSDGDGFRMCWDWKGASSTKPCWKHFNVFRKGSHLAHRKPGYCEIDCTNPAAFRSWSAAQVYKVADSLVAAATQVSARAMTKGNWHDLEVSLGMNTNKKGLLMSMSLRPRAAADPCTTAVRLATVSLQICIGPLRQPRSFSDCVAVVACTLAVAATVSLQMQRRHCHFSGCVDS